MPRDQRLQVWLLALLCAAMLAARAGGAHLHLCLDGSEPPSGLHLFDLGQHHDDPGADRAHSDVEVDFAGELIAKGKVQWQLPLALLAAVVLLGLLSPSRLAVLWISRSFLPPHPLFLRPPQCGPPC